TPNHSVISLYEWQSNGTALAHMVGRRLGIKMRKSLKTLTGSLMGLFLILAIFALSPTTANAQYQGWPGTSVTPQRRDRAQDRRENNNQQARREDRSQERNER